MRSLVMRDHGTAAGAGWRTVPERGGISAKRPGVLERPSLWTWNPSRVLKGIMSKRGQEETGAWEKKTSKPCLVFKALRVKLLM